MQNRSRGTKVPRLFSCLCGFSKPSGPSGCNFPAIRVKLQYLWNRSEKGASSHAGWIFEGCGGHAGGTGGGLRMEPGTDGRADASGGGAGRQGGLLPGAGAHGLHLRGSVLAVHAAAGRGARAGGADGRDSGSRPAGLRRRAGAGAGQALQLRGGVLPGRAAGSGAQDEHSELYGIL